jgi:phosphate transport system permease protein
MPTTFLREASHKRQALFDLLFRNLTRVSAFGVLALLAAIIGSLVLGSMPAIRAFGFGFLTSSDWDPVNDQFGALIPIIGTLVTSCIALFIAIPVSFGIATFLTELSPRILRRPLGIAVELLAGIPSIIYGMWGLFVFAPLFADHFEPWINDHIGTMPLIGPYFSGPPMGIGMLTAGIILAIMVIPFIASVMRDVFDVVPAMLKESAYAVGATTWEVMWNVVLPYTKVGVAGGIMLGLGRALGETMAVTFVIGNAHDLSKSLLMPGNSISSALANEFNEAVGDLYTSSLIELGLILFFITFVVLSIARYMLFKLGQREGKTS